MIHVCRKTGDLSPLSPLSLKDLIWLETDERIEEEERIEEKKVELSIQGERILSLTTVLSDLRYIQIAKLPLNQSELKDFLISLPSFKGDKKKAKEDLRWKVKQRKPGEIPEWKKQRMKQQNNSTDQEPAKKTG